jgi:DNA-binding CsgD family transcriptional regulator
VVDRVSPGIAQLIGESAADVVGRPLFELLDVDDPPCMIRELAARDAGPLIRGGVRLRGRHAVSAPGRLVVFPMDPVGSCVFTFEPAGDRAVADVMLSARRRPIAEAMHRLSHRERQIVLRLVGGDRVPLIARELFLSQSTVRNQLSAAYRKLGVSSQQELIHLFRCTGAPAVGVRT